MRFGRLTAYLLALPLALALNPAIAQTLTATHQFGGPLYEGDQNVPVTISGFTISGECSEIGLNLVTGNSSDFSVSSESLGQPCDSTRTDARFVFTFKDVPGGQNSKTLEHELYSVDKTDSTKTTRGRFTLTIRDGRRPQKVSLSRPISGGGTDPKKGIELQEGSAAVTIEVWLTHPPPDENRSARVDFTSNGQALWGGTSVGGASASRYFTKDNYADRQTITLRPDPDDNSDDWKGHVDVDPALYYYLPIIRIPVTVIDRTAVPVFDSNSLTLIEGGPAKSYTVKLDREPAADVTLVTKAHTHLRFKGPDDSAFGEQATVTFTTGASGTWKTPQTIQVKHIQDSNGNNESAQIVHERGSGTQDWQLQGGNVSVTLTDAGNAPIFSRDSVSVIEGGTAQSYTVKLERDPGSAVVLAAEVPPEHRQSVKVQAPGGQAGARAELTFTRGASGTWKTPQTITVTAVSDDNLIDETVTLTHSTSSSSLNWPTGVKHSVEVQVSDRGGGEVEISRKPSAVYEGLEAVTYDVSLSHPPADEAIVTITSSDTTKLVVSPTTLKFDAGNYDQAQTVSLSSPAGSVTEGDGATITHAVTGYGATTAGPQFFAALVDTTLTETLNLQFSKPRFSGKEGTGGSFGIPNPAQVEVTLQGSNGYRGFLPAVSFRVCFQDDDGAGRASVFRKDIATLSHGKKCVDDSLDRIRSAASVKTTLEVFKLLGDSADEKFEKLTVTLQAHPDNPLPAMVTIPQAGSKADFFVEDAQLTEVKFTRTDSGSIQEGGSDKATFEFATVSRSLYAGEELRVPLKIGGTGITGDDYTVSVVSGGTLSTSAPYSASAPALVIKGSGNTSRDVNGNSQKIVFEVAALADGTAEGGSETMTVGHTAPVSNLNTDGVRFETGATELASDSQNDVEVEIIEHPTVSIAADGDVTEGNDAVFTVTVAPAPGTGESISVTYDLAQTGDFVAAADVGTGKTVSVDDTGSAKITVATVDDSVDETDGSLAATLVSGTGYVIAAAPDNAATVNISDDEDTLVTLSADSNVTEGGKATVTATINGLAQAADVTIPINVTTGDSGGTAETTDYDAPASITITAGEKTGTTELITHLDADKDADTVKLALGTLPDGLAAGDPASVTVSIDDDGKGVEATLTSSAAAVDNGDPVTITVTLDRAFAANTPIPITVAGSGTNPAEAAEWDAPASIEVAAGATSATADIDTIRDQDTASEEFTVGFGSPLPANLSTGDPDSAKVTINDDGLGHSITFSASPNPVDEDTITTLTATANGIFDADVTVPLALTNGTAESGDYATPTTGITIAKGAMSGTGTLTTIGDADTVDDTFNVRVGTPLPSGVVASSAGYTITIKDTKAFAVVPPKLTMTTTPEADDSSDVFVDEGESITVTATLDRAHSADIVLPVTMIASNGTDSTDFSAPANITIEAGQTTGIGTITANQDDDINDEEYLYVQVDLSGLGEAVEHDGSYVFYVTIVDDDKPPPVVRFEELGPLTDSESGIVRVRIVAETELRPDPNDPTYVVRLPFFGNLKVIVDVTQEGRYVKSTSLGRHTLAFPGDRFGSYEFELDDDAIDEPNGSITLTLVEDASYKIDSREPEYKTLSGPMQDNDETLVTLTAPDGDISEAGGSKTFTVTLSRALVDGEVLPINLTFGSGTSAATLGTDFTLSPPTSPPSGVSFTNFNRTDTQTPTITFTGGVGAATSTTFTLTAKQDTEVEQPGLPPVRKPYETVQVKIRDFFGQKGLGGGADGRPEPEPNIQFRINDDDGNLDADPGLVLSDNNGMSISEGKSETFTIKLATQPTSPVTVAISYDSEFSDVSDALSVSPTSLPFTTSNWNQPQSVKVTALADEDAENERTYINITPTGYTGASGELMELQTEDAGAGLTLTSPSPSSLTVNNTGTYTVKLKSKPSNDVTVTPVSSDERIATVSGDLTFTPTKWNQAQTVTVTGASAGNVQIAHTWKSNDSDYKNRTMATSPVVFSVSDTGNRTLSLEALTTTVEEGKSVTVTAKLDRAHTADVAGLLRPRSVGSSVGGQDMTAETADFTPTANPTNITIPKGSTSASVVFTAVNEAEGSAIYEGEETFGVDLFSGGTSGVSVDRNNNSAIITITDEADQPVFELVPPDPLNGAEGDQSKDRVFKVTKTGTTEVDATVDIATADGTATEPGDYTAIPANTALNFAAGDTEKSVTVSFEDDTDDELKEDFTVTISNPTDARLGATTSATVELTDDDPTVVQLTVGALAIKEADGTKDIMVTLARALTTGEILPVTLDFAGDAAFGEDYTLSAPQSKPTGVAFSNLASTDPVTNKPTITFTGGDSASNTASITLTATGDKADEGDDESVTVSLGVLGASSGTGLDGGAKADSTKYTGSFKITDDDGTPTSISLSVDTDTATDGVQDKVSEGVASPPSVEVTASIDGGSVFTDDKTIRIEVVGDTATVGDDFEAVTGFDLEIPAGDSSVKGSFTLTPVYDGVKEADETISVTGALTPAVQGLTVKPATITLTDDSVIPEISVAVDNSGKNITEGGDAVWTLTSSVSIPVDLTVNVTLTQQGSFVAAQTLTDTATVTIPKNTTSATLTVATEADSADEVDGSLSLTLAAADNGEYTVSATKGDADVAVSDDDATSIALLAGASTTLTEGDTSTSATLTLRLGRALVAGEIVEAPLAITTSTGAVISELTDANRDYLLAVSGTGVTGNLVRRPNPKVKFTGAAGVREATITLTATARDDDDEDHESLSITLGNIKANNLATSISGGVVKHDADNDPQTPENTVDITIQDDEGLKPELNVDWASGETLDNSPTEGGTVKMLIKADPAPQADMTVHFTVSERAGANYVAADEEGAKTVTLRKGATEVAVNVPTVNDENDEIGGLVRVTLVANDAYRLGGRDGYSRLVKDDDATPVTIERDCGLKDCHPISENGATAEFAISLGLALNNANQTVTVPLNVAGATAGTHYTLALKSGAQTGVTWLDSGSYSAQNPAVRFSGERAKKAVLTLTTIDNNDNNTRTLNVSLGTLEANQTVYGGVEKGAASTASVKIVNDDGTPVVRVEAQVAEMYEGQDVGGSRRPNPRMYIYADPVPQTDITVSATLSQIGDVIDASGTPPGKHSYTFKAGQAAPQVVEFRIDNDLDDEPTSFVTLEVHAGQGYTLSPTKSSATTRVTDKDGGPTVSLTAASASVTEGGNATFTLTRGTEGAEPRWEDTGISRVRLRISQRGDFVADEDLGEKTITLTKGQTSATYEVPTIGDGKGEKDGTITVELLPNRTNVNQLSGYAVDFAPNNQAVITVVDDDGGAPGVLFYNLNTAVSEKNLSKTGSYTVELATDPVQTATLTVNVPAAHQDSLTVQAPGGTAGSSAALDFTPGAGGTWDTPQMITVAPLIDEDGDPDTFALTHSIANYPGHTGPIDDVSVTVTDRGYNLKLSHNNGNNKLEVAEPAGQESYSLWLTSRPANSVTVTPTSSDATLASVGGAVTFTSTDWKDPKPITVSGLKQGTLTITHAVTSTDPNYQFSGNFPVGVTVIADNRRTVELSAAPDPVAEGADVTLTATIPQAVYPQKAVTIPLTYTEGTAVAADYTETASITIDAGQTTGTATLATVDDTAHETPDETFTVAFGTLPRELLAGATTSVDISIDDAADVARKIDLSVAKNPVREGDDSVELTVTLDSALTAPARAVTIPLSYTLGTAQAEDFTEVADVTIAAGEASATVTIPIVDDTTYETPHETFTIGLGALPAGLEAGETVEIEVEIDDTSDAPAVVTFEASEVRAPDTGHVVTVQLDKPLPQDLTIPLVYTFGTAKASDINQVANITIAAGNSGPVTGGTITFNLVNNSIFDGGTFTLGLGALPLPAAQLVSGDIDEMEITILDEADSPDFAYASPETGGVTHLVEGSPELALIRTGNVTASSFIAYRTSRYSGGAATPGSDYELTPVGESALSEVPGGGAMPTLTLPIIDDDEDEFFSEYFYFEVQRNGHIGAKSVPNGRRTIRIVDDDPTPVSLSPSSDVSIDEGDDNTTARLTLKLARPLNTSYFPDGRLEEVAEIPLVITTSSGAALPGSADPDFTIAVSGGAVTATGLNSATPKIKFETTSGIVQNANIATITITATTRDDGDFQDEAIQIALGDLTASTLATNLEGGVSASDDGDPGTTDNVIDLKIVDDEEGPDGFDLSVDTGSVAENAQAAATINVTATAKGGGSFTEDHDIEITVGGGAEDTAISGTDYAAVAKFTFTVTAGQSSGSGSFSLEPTDDTLDEADETLSVTGASGSLEITPASITITDDDAEPTVSVADAAAVAEGDDPALTVDMTFTVSLSAASGKDVTVPYTLTGTATDGADYDAPATQSLSIAAGDTSGEIVIPVKGDAIDEVDETIIVTLSAPTNATVASEAGAGAATGSITDDDVPELSISGGAAVAEGTAASFTVDADIAPVADLTVKVDVDTTAGFAASDTTGAQTFTFRAGEMSETYEVNTESDSIDEADGSVSVTLKDGSDYTVATTGDTASVEVNDDDATSVTLGRTGSGGIAEDGGAVDVTVTLGRALVVGESITVPLTVSGATVATHYTLALKDGGGTGVSLDTAAPHGAQNPAVTLAGAGAQTATLTLTAVANTDRVARTVAIAYGTSARAPSSSSLSGGIATTGSASVAILDDDAKISVGDASAAEGSAVAFTVTLPDPAPSGGVTIDYSTSDGRGESTDATHQVATSADDYTAAAANASITIAQGDSSGAISIPTTDDDTYEGDHYFTLTLDSTDNFNISDTAGSSTGTITDAADTPSFAFSAASTDAEEDDGTVTLTVARTGKTLVAATVSYATADGTATGGSDFTAIASTNLSFAVADTSKDITVSVTNDSNDEPAEAFTVDLTAGAHAQLGTANSHTVNITDNDATTVTLEAPSTAIDENAGAKTITVTLGRALTGDETLSVPLTFSGTATFGTDYTLAAPNSTPTGVSYSNLASTDLGANPPTISFSGVNGAADSATVILTATADTTDEGASEAVTVGLGTLNANSGTNLGGGASGSGTATFNITDDDDAPGGITLTLDKSTIAEDAATATVTVTASVTGGTAYATNKTVKVKVGESGDTAVEGADYANVADYDLTINAMETSAEWTFSLDPTDDTLDEDTETLSVTGTSGDIAVTGASITITDDDAAPTVSVADATAVNEGNDPNTTVNLSFAVTLDAASGKQVTVPYTLGGTAAATDDYTEPNPLSVVIAAGSRSASIDVPVKGDTLDEPNETVTVTLGAPTNATVSTTEGAGEASGTITDDDATPTVTLNLSPAAIGESGAANESTVTASLNGATSQDLTLTVAAAPVSPALAGDFTLSTNKTLTIAAGSTDSAGAVTVTAVDNSVDAPDKTVTVSAAASGGNGVASPTDVTLTINDDEGTPTVSVADATAVAEGNDPMTTKDMSFALTLSGTSSQAVTVPYTLTGSATGGSDYETPNPLSATIAAGQRSGTILVKVKGDTADEVDETIDVTLGSPTNATVSTVQGAGTASGTITDDDATTVLLARAGSGGIAENGRQGGPDHHAGPGAGGGRERDGAA